MTGKNWKTCVLVSVICLGLAFGVNHFPVIAETEQVPNTVIDTGANISGEKEADAEEEPLIPTEVEPEVPSEPTPETSPEVVPSDQYSGDQPAEEYPSEGTQENSPSPENEEPRQTETENTNPGRLKGPRANAPLSPGSAEEASGELSVKLTYADGKTAREEATDKKQFFPRSSMYTYLKLETHDMSEDPENVVVTVTVPKRFIDSFKIPEFNSQSPHTISAMTVDGDNYKITITFPRYDRSESLGFPVVLSFTDETTPIGFETSVSAEITWDGAAEPAKAEEDAVFIAKYQDYGFRKYVTSNKSEIYGVDGAMAVIGSYESYGDQFYLDKSTAIPFAFKVNEKAGSSFTYQDYRDVESIKITDTLPTYTDVWGNPRTAQFDPAINPGWEMDAQGQSVSKTYVGANTSEILKTIYNDQTLKLYMEGLILKTGDDGSTVFAYEDNHADIVGIPSAREDGEPAIVTQDDLQFQVTSKVSADGSFMKIANYGGTKTVYEGQPYTTREFPWLIGFDSKSTVPMENIVLTDHELDSRLRFTRVATRSTDTSLPDGLSYPDIIKEIHAFKEDGSKDVYAPVFGADGQMNTSFSDSIVYTAFDVVFKDTFSMMAGDKIRFTAYTIYKEPETYYDPAGEDFNKYANTAALNTELHLGSLTKTVTFTSGDLYSMLPIIESVPITKKQTGNSTTRNNTVGSKFSYYFQFRPTLIEGKTYENLRIVDLLPDGIEPTGAISFGKDYVIRMENVDNYHNSGRRAVIFYLDAEKIQNTPQGNTQQQGLFQLTFQVEIKENAIPGTVKNECYVVGDNLKEYTGTTGGTEDVYDLNNNGKTDDKVAYSFANAYIVTSESIYAQKFIAHAGSSNWAKSGFNVSPGEAYDYKLMVTNNSGESHGALKMYDFLPKIGDKNALGGKERGTEFAVQLRDAVTPPTGYRVRYSTDTDLLGRSMKDVLTDSSVTWQDSVEEYTTVTAILLEALDGTVLPAGESVSVVLPCKAIDNIEKVSWEKLKAKAPEDGELSGITTPLDAFNDFGYQTDRQADPKQSNIIRTQIRFAGFVVKKLDQATDAPLEGATFTLNVVNEQGDVVGTQITDEQGAATFTGLTEGTYTLQETNPPKGYKRGTEGVSVEITRNTTTGEYSTSFKGAPGTGTSKVPLLIYNEKKTSLKVEHAKVSVEKADPAGATLQNAQFALYSDVDLQTKVLEFTAGKKELSTEDAALAGHLPEAGKTTTLYLQETQAPDGYKKDLQVHQVKISANEEETYDQQSDSYVTTRTYSMTIGGQNILTVKNNPIEPCKITIQAQKVLTGREWQNDEAYSFILLSTRQDTPMPEGAVARTDGISGKRTYSASVSGTGSEKPIADFLPISYSYEDLKNEDGSYAIEKEFYYGIREVIPQDVTREADGSLVKNGIVFDSSEHSAHVKLVYDKDSGALSAKVTYFRGGNTEAANLPYFENIYRTQPVSFDIEIAKFLNDQPLANGSFSFSLTDNNDDHTNLQYLNGDVAVGEEIMNSAVTGADQGIKTLDLSNLLLLKSAGTYHFQVHEILPGGVHASGDYYKKNGYSYDNRTVNVTVTVTDDGKGTLTPSVSYDGVSATNAAFYNKYEAEGIGTIRLEKHISGREWTDQDAFNFTLEAVTNKAPMPLNSTVTATNENRKCTFDDIIFELDDLANAETDADGIKYFEYRITEDAPDGVTPKADGTWEYQGLTSSRPATVRLNVEDLGNGIIKVTYGKAKSNTIDAPDMTNTYKANQITAVLKVSKKITGVDGDVLTDWKNKTFTFVIENTRSTTPLPHNTSITINDQAAKEQAGKDKDGNEQTLPTGVSEEITYTQPGVYDYVIREQLPDGMSKMQPVDSDSLVYDTSEHSAQVVVTDDGKGNLEAEVRYHGGNDDLQPIFYNRYSKDTEYMLQASKVLKGRKLLGGEFSFALYKAFTQSADQSPVIDKDFAKDDVTAEANFISRATVDSNGNIYFLPIILSHDEYAAYDKDYDKGTSENTLDLYYAVREEAPSGAEVNADGSWTKLTDEQTGMTNKTGTIYYKVTLEHLPEEGPEETHEVVLKAIAYSYDGDQWKSVYTKPASEQQDEKRWSEIPAFHNEYTSVGKATIDASKHIDGREWKENDHFVFSLTAEGGAPLRTNVDGPDMGELTAISTKDHKIADFTDLVFSQEDLKDAEGTYQDEVTYTYRIHEVEGYATKIEEIDGEEKEIKVPLGGFLYAADQLVTVHLADQGDGTIKVTYGKNRTNTIENPQFHNLYLPAAVEAQVEVVKTLNGREWLSSDAFTFTLTPDNPEYPMPIDADGEEVRQAVITIDSENLVADEEGTKKENFPSIRFNKAGTYTYSIREEAGTILGIHYSQTEHSVTVMVTDDGMGKLCAKVLYVGGSRQEPSAFTNTYSAEPVTVILEGRKTMIGRELFGGHYSFNLYQTPDQSYDLADEETALIGNVTVSATGEMEGRSITYTEPGDYYYVAAERVPLDAENPQFPGVSYLQATEEQKQTHGWMFEGVTYSTNYCKIHVEVTDQLNGTMEAQVTYDNSTAVAEQDREEQDKAAFTNSYDASGSAFLEVTKYFENGTLTEGMYTFELKALEKDIPMPMKTTVSNTGDGKILFGPIDYTLADLGPDQHYREFHYEITEHIPDEKTVVYDPKTITVTVKVDDYGNGILGTTVSYSDNAFTNKKQEPLKVKVSVEKKLTGDKTPKEETFKFILEDKNKEKQEELRITGEGKGGFPEIVIDQTGTYTYYIAEVNTRLEHYTYDQQRYVLVATVKTDDIGNLVSTSELKDEAGNPVNEVCFTNNYKEPDQPSTTQKEEPPKALTTEVTTSAETAKSTEETTKKDTESKQTEESRRTEASESQAQNVATGDPSKPEVWAGVLLLSMMSILLLLRKRGQDKKS